MRYPLFLFYFLFGCKCFGANPFTEDLKILNNIDHIDSSSVKQSIDSLLKIINGKSYFDYQVKKGDTWYSIAKSFGITYSELRLANSKSDDQLFPDRNILIPSNKLKANDPFYQKKQLDSAQANITKKEIIKFHVVSRSQTLYSISKMYGISVKQLKEWNKLNLNTINIGQKLIVSKEVDLGKSSTNKKLEVKPETKAQQSDIEKSKAEITEQVPSVVSEVPNEKIAFASNRKEINENGIAIFVEDEDSNIDKYYAFHRTAPIGTVIRVLNKSNSKQVYVKIIGQLPGKSEDDDILIKISKACAEKLNVTDKSFQVNLLYGIDKE